MSLSAANATFPSVNIDIIDIYIIDIDI